jgi:hypothetical protein
VIHECAWTGCHNNHERREWSPSAEPPSGWVQWEGFTFCSEFCRDALISMQGDGIPHASCARCQEQRRFIEDLRRGTTTA